MLCPEDCDNITILLSSSSDDDKTARRFTLKFVLGGLGIEIPDFVEVPLTTFFLLIQPGLLSSLSLFICLEIKKFK